MSNQPRKPKGTPVGGQFDRTLGGGPATTLGATTLENDAIDWRDNETRTEVDDDGSVCRYDANGELHSFQKPADEYNFPGFGNRWYQHGLKVYDEGGFWPPYNGQNVLIREGNSLIVGTVMDAGNETEKCASTQVAVVFNQGETLQMRRIPAAQLEPVDRFPYGGTGKSPVVGEIGHRTWYQNGARATENNGTITYKLGGVEYLPNPVSRGKWAEDSEEFKHHCDRAIAQGSSPICEGEFTTTYLPSGVKLQELNSSLGTYSRDYFGMQYDASGAPTGEEAYYGDGVTPELLYNQENEFPPLVHRNEAGYLDSKDGYPAVLRFNGVCEYWDDGTLIAVTSGMSPTRPLIFTGTRFPPRWQEEPERPVRRQPKPETLRAKIRREFEKTQASMDEFFGEH